MLHFFIPGNPKSQARPRTFIRGGKPITWSPKDKEWYPFLVAAAMAHRQNPLLEGPLRLTLSFTFVKPKSKPKRIKWPDVTPDLDNLVIAIQNAFKGRIYRDDAQICQLYVDKTYGNPPGAEVLIEPLS